MTTAKIGHIMDSGFIEIKLWRGGQSCISKLCTTSHQRPVQGSKRVAGFNGYNRETNYLICSYSILKSKKGLLVNISHILESLNDQTNSKIQVKGVKKRLTAMRSLIIKFTNILYKNNFCGLSEDEKKTIIS